MCQDWHSGLGALEVIVISRQKVLQQSDIALRKLQLQLQETSAAGHPACFGTSQTFDPGTHRRCW